MKKHIYNKDLALFPLKEKEVHIWNFDISNISDENRNLLREVLLQDELQRAAKFHFEKDRERFVSGSGLLRLLIKLYTSIPAKDISFEQNKYRKPDILIKQNTHKIYFNMSNSQNFVCIGFIKNEQIGVDIEVIKPIKDYLDVANNFFSEVEKTQLKTYSEDKAMEAFYTCWTGKEAFIKYLGEGLSHPLKEFDVEIRDLNVDETYKYNIQTKSRNEIFFVEAFRLKNELVGAYSLKEEPQESIYLIFDETSYSVNSFIREQLI